MDYEKLAQLLFPDVNETIADLEKEFPERNLPQGAMVTRLGPSPTGFMHLGNLYVALADERLAHQSEGVFILRIEDTDEKRKVDGAEEVIVNGLNYFGIAFDEGGMPEGDKGSYGPYHQSQRAKIYHVVAAHLVREGFAYPSFATEAEIAEIRKAQEAEKITPGYYGKWATDRHLTYDEIKTNLDLQKPWVLRLRAQGNPLQACTLKDGIRGNVSVPANEQDAVLLKTNGIPTYHFAHVVDDHFMRITHILRGEEWLSTLPLHLELFAMLGWEHPVFCHTSHLMKIDAGTRRKLSKRKDPESSLSYYMEKGYHPLAVREYLMTLLNSDYEQWRLANPDTPLEAFTITLDKMATSGALFDMDKLNDIAKDVFLRLSAEDIATFFLAWAKNHSPERYQLYEKAKTALIGLFDIGRSGKKPRKDLIYAEQMEEHIAFFFADFMEEASALPPEVSAKDAKAMIDAYLTNYDEKDDNSAWFAKVRDIATDFGYAAKPKDYKKNPEAYKGHVGHVSGVIRLAVTGKEASPDLWSVQQIMGIDEVKRRLEAFKARI